MLSRRAFVGAGAALAVLAAPPARAIPHAYHGAPGTAPFRVLFDRTFGEGRAYGAALERRGAHVDGVGTDLAAYWMRTLEPLLRRGPLTLAGLTASAPLFCLELLCRGYGLRTVYRIEHSVERSGRVRHTLTGDSTLAPWTHRLAAAGAEWAAEAAELATGGATLPRPAPAIELLDLAGGRVAQSLFTWVIGNRS